MQKQIDEVMGLVDDFALKTDAYQNGEASKDEMLAARRAVKTKLRELLPVWQPIESAEKPAIGANGFGERILILVDCGDGTIKSTRIGWWCDKWMMDTGGSVKENWYRVVGWMPLPKAPE